MGLIFGIFFDGLVMMVVAGIVARQAMFEEFINFVWLSIGIGVAGLLMALAIAQTDLPPWVLFPALFFLVAAGFRRILCNTWGISFLAATLYIVLKFAIGLALAFLFQDTSAS